MKELVLAIKDACTELADSKLELHFLTQFRNAKIRFGKGTVQNTAEAAKGWRHEEMYKEKAMAYFQVLFESLEGEENIIAKIDYEIMSELRLWYTTNDNLLNKTRRKGGKAKAGSVRHWIMNKVRDTFHNKYQKTAQLPLHGVTLSLS